MTLITLPWPPRVLSPNDRPHWHSKAKATRQYRRDAFYAARAAKVPVLPGAILVFTYHPPDRRRRDVQNIPAMLKPAIDGIADAMGTDDHGFRPRFPDRFADPVKGGAVVIEIRPALVSLPIRGVMS